MKIPALECSACLFAAIVSASSESSTSPLTLRDAVGRRIRSYLEHSSANGLDEKGVYEQLDLQNSAALKKLMSCLESKNVLKKSYSAVKKRCEIETRTFLQQIAGDTVGIVHGRLGPLEDKGQYLQWASKKNLEEFEVHLEEVREIYKRVLSGKFGIFGVVVMVILGLSILSCCGCCCLGYCYLRQGSAVG